MSSNTFILKGNSSWWTTGNGSFADASKVSFIFEQFSNFPMQVRLTIVYGTGSGPFTTTASGSVTATVEIPTNLLPAWAIPSHNTNAAPRSVGTVSFLPSTLGRPNVGTIVVQAGDTLQLYMAASETGGAGAAHPIAATTSDFGYYVAA